MPVVPHSQFRRPKDPATTPIWRYLDLAKLLRIVQSSALHFARADTLGDPFEGSLSVATVRMAAEPVPRIAKTFQLQSAISCWHISPHESAAMWSLYGPINGSVAIRSTVDRLIRSFNGAAEEIYVGVVSYIDYDAVPMSMDNALIPILHKRLSYVHENELRAVTLFRPPHSGTWDHANNPVGLDVQVDLDVLVEAVYISPGAPNWYLETIRALVPFEVRQSKLGEEPVF